MPDVDLSTFSAATGGSSRLTGYLARPAALLTTATEPLEPVAGVVVIHEIFGLTEIVRRHTEHIAELGYLALAVDLYSDGGARRCLVSTMRTLFAGDGPAFADIEAARQSLLASAECDGRVGVIGFCMGGGFALLAASSGFDVAAVNYGKLPDDLDAAVADVCPIVASYGGRDRSLPNAAARLGHALTQAEVEHDVKDYPQAGHSFLNDVPFGRGPVPRMLRVAGIGPEPDSAADAWGRIATFFAAHLT